MDVLIRKILNKTLIGGVKRLLLNFPPPYEIKKQLIQAGGDEKMPVFIFPLPSTPWGYLFQRPQQFAKTLSAMGYPVIYCVDTSFPGEPDFSIRGLQQIQEQLYLFNDGYNGETLEVLAERAVIWQYWPNQYPIVKKGPWKAHIYDCIDHLSTFQPDRHLVELHAQSLEEADIVLASASLIEEELLAVRKDVLLVENAVNPEDFTCNQSSDNVLSLKLEELTASYSSVVGYYGAIAEWMDLDLITYCADKNPDHLFLLVGQKYPGIKIPTRPNIVRLDRISYESLPTLLSFIDVCIVPFLINEITMHTSPVKLFEYLAAGKAVVSTCLPEVLKYPIVYTADTKQKFEQYLHVAIRQGKLPEYQASAQLTARMNSWQIRAQKVIDKLKHKKLI